MESLPCKGCRGLCCGPVPVTEKELKDIKKKVKSMPQKYRMTLESQPRFAGTCIFFDQDNDKCGIHNARPAVCRAFGHFSNLVCFRQPEAAVSGEWQTKEKPVGILSVNYTWRDFR
jgi:Fe-S-cluster containining protein